MDRSDLSPAFIAAALNDFINVMGGTCPAFGLAKIGARTYSKSSPETLKGTNNQNWIVYYKDLDVTFKTSKKTDFIQTAKSGKHPNL